MFAALTLSLQLQQTSFDLLDGVSIALAAHNSASTPAIVKFSKPAEYEIQVLRGNEVIWTNQTVAPESTSFPVHTHKFVSGPSVLVVYIWNAVEADGSLARSRTVHGTRALTRRGRDARSDSEGAFHRSISQHRDSAR